MPGGFRATYRNFPEHFYYLKRWKIAIACGSVTRFTRKILDRGNKTSAKKPGESRRPRKS